MPRSCPPPRCPRSPPICHGLWALWQHRPGPHLPQPHLQVSADCGITEAAYFDRGGRVVGCGHCAAGAPVAAGAVAATTNAIGALPPVGPAATTATASPAATAATTPALMTLPAGGSPSLPSHRCGVRCGCVGSRAYPLRECGEQRRRGRLCCRARGGVPGWALPSGRRGGASPAATSMLVQPTWPTLSPHPAGAPPPTDRLTAATDESAAAAAVCKASRWGRSGFFTRTSCVLTGAGVVSAGLAWPSCRSLDPPCGAGGYPPPPLGQDAVLVWRGGPCGASH